MSVVRVRACAVEGTTSGKHSASVAVCLFVHRAGGRKTKQRVLGA